MKFYLLVFIIFSAFLAAKKLSSTKSAKTQNKKSKSSSLPKKKVSLNDDDDDDNSDRDDFDDSPVSNSLVQSTFDLTKQLAISLGKAGKSLVKSTVNLCVVKHVTIDQIHGKWLLRQEVEVRKGIFVSCPATIQFMEDGTVVTVFEGVKHETKLTFTERQWPLKCTVKFEAKAFQESEGSEPVRMLYKGYFKGSITNPRVLLLRGKIYRLSGKMWKKQTRCGEFKGIKRRYH